MGNTLLYQASGYNVAGTEDSEYTAIFKPESFSQGVSRIAHQGVMTAPPSQRGLKVVVKEFKSEYAHFKNDWKVDLEVSAKAEEMAKRFNKLSSTDRPIHFRKPLAMKVDGTTFSGHSTCREGEWVIAESFLHGDYIKWTSNAGYVNEAQMGGGGSLAAFSHWSWVETGGKLIICDLQGVKDRPRGYWLTDPAINSSSQTYGQTDMGNAGIHLFFKTHKCGAICRSMGLERKLPPRCQLVNHHRLNGLTSKESSSYRDQLDLVGIFIPLLVAIMEEEEEEEEEDY